MIYNKKTLLKDKNIVKQVLRQLNFVLKKSLIISCYSFVEIYLFASPPDVKYYLLLTNY